MTGHPTDTNAAPLLGLLGLQCGDIMGEEKRREAGAGWLSLASSLMKDPVWLTPPLRLLLCHRAVRCRLWPHDGAAVSLVVLMLAQLTG